MRTGDREVGHAGPAVGPPVVAVDFGLGLALILLADLAADVIELVVKRDGPGVVSAAGQRGARFPMGRMIEVQPSDW